MAIDLLRQSLEALRAEDIAVWQALGSAGMLCIRHVRGMPSVPSNHAFGLAIDFTLDGQLDVRGDRMVMAGLIRLYRVMKRFGWFWGAEFSVEDAMHFEVGSAVVRDWIRRGVF